MNLKNYTSGISTDVTISRIERLLMDAGATGIMKRTANRSVVAIAFQIPVDKDRLVTVQLPANAEACMDAFWKDHCSGRSLRSKKTREDFRDQSERTAWKLQQDWVEVQLSLIRLKQQDVVAAFLPHIVTDLNGSTVYEKMKSNGFKALLPEKAS